MSRLFITVSQAQALTSLQGLDERGRQQAIDDAAAVLAIVDASPWVREGDLRVLLERQDIGPDRATRALAFLVEISQLVTVPAAATAPVPAPLPDLNALTVATLQAIAGDLNLKGRSAMGKAELIDAITAAAATTTG